MVSTRATSSTTPAPVAVTPGSARTPSLTGDTVKLDRADQGDGGWRWKSFVFEGVFLFKSQLAAMIMSCGYQGASLMQPFF